ncbi:MAG: S10 family peptidase [Phycisphaerales bacterium]
MSHRFLITAMLALLCVCARAPGQAAPASAAPATTPVADKPKDAKEPPRPSVTEHEVTIGGQSVRYVAAAGTLPLLDDKQKAKASVFYVSYSKLSGGEGSAAVAAGTPAARPITFAFNGGPGSSSVWLHMGALGPRRVKMADAQGLAPMPPGEVIANEHSWLDFTDLVFIDPVSTGYSRAAEGEDAKQFHGLEEDVKWMGEFIRLYLVRHQRWASPKYLAGESYGTTRAAGLAGELQGRHGILLNGIVLISPILHFLTASFDVGNDLPFILYLPTYAATAKFHGKVPDAIAPDIKTVVARATEFAGGEYAAALLKGDGLEPAARAAIVKRLSELTGLSADFIERSNLRVPIGAFTKELLRDQRRTVGRLDSRYKGIDRDAAGERTEYDPSYATIQGPYTAALNGYVRGELNFESDINYEILTGNVRPWNYAPNTNRYANVAETLRSAMSQNRNLRVLSCSGYFDLATPVYAMDYTITHMGLDPEVRQNISQTFYESGHMMYVREEDLAKLRTDVAQFYTRR